MTNQPTGSEESALPPEIRWALRRADGFMDLGMWDQAEQEMRKVPVSARGHTPYLQLRLRAAMASEDWGPARKIAMRLTEREPEEPAYWVQLAYATRRAVGLPAAHEILTQAIRRFPGEAIFPYNLGCYECCLGHPEKALQRLREAIRLDAAYAELALDDPDLTSLRPLVEALLADEPGMD